MGAWESPRAGLDAFEKTNLSRRESKDDLDEGADENV
jgi:hypothetical protein